MPKKSKRKDKNTGKPKNGTNNKPEVGSDVSTSQCCDVRYRENPVKSDADPNEYRVIELPNGLVALLISCPTDPSIQKEDRVIHKLPKYFEPNWFASLEKFMASQGQQVKCPAVCCLCVNAGYFSDSRQVPGVSHVLGAAIFGPAFLNDPKISSECKKVLKRACAHEMVPKSEATIFYIAATHRVYRDAIERLGHSLESVVIPKYQTEIAQEAVVNFDEIQRIVLTPEKEAARIFSQFVSSRHPAKTFSEHYLGSLRQVDTDKVYREVQKFRKRHYSAHRMTVVMKAELPLDTLETHAKECFSRITNNGLPPQLFDSYNFVNSVENTKFRRIWPIDSAGCNEVHVKWIMPPSSWLYRTKTLQFLGWLLSYGGAGSLMSYLKMQKWATEVLSGVLNEPAWNTSLYSTFCISVALTANGNRENKLDVLDAIYSYINFLRNKGPQKSIYDDIRIIRNAEFRYRQADLKDFTDFAKLAEDMHIYPSTDYLAAPFFWYEYDPVSLSTCLDLMTPTKACIVVTDESFGEHLDIKLAGLARGERSTDIPEDWIVRWQTMKPLPGFKLPERNIFCPDDLRMIDAPAVLQKYPIKVHSDSMSEVWYKFDEDLRVPKCRMNFCYVSPPSFESPENAAMLDLFALVLKDLLHDELYPATEAGLSYTIESYFLGLGINVSGYTQKLPLLTQVFAQSIPEIYHSLTKSLFEAKKEELLGRYHENFSSAPNLAKQVRNSIFIHGLWMDVDKHAALFRLQFERFQHFTKHFVDHVYIKCLVNGNIAEADAVKNALRVIEVSRCGPVSRDMITRIRINEIPHGKHCCTVKAFGLDSSDVAVENYYEFDDSSTELGGALRFFVGFLTSATVQDLRTFDFAMTASYSSDISKNGTNNYVLRSLDSCTSTINAKRIASIDAGIEEKRQSALDYLKDCRGDVWKHTKDVVVAAMRRTGDICLREFENNWEDIVRGKHAFGKVSRQLDALDNMDSEEFHKWIKYITNDSNIRKLSIRTICDKYNRADFSTVKTQPDKLNTEPNNIPPHQLQYLTEHARRTGNTSYNCIIDIHGYKKQLEASSKTNVTS